MRKQHSNVEVEAYLVHETGSAPDEGAFLIRIERDKKVWLPKAAVEKHPHPTNSHPDIFIFEMPEQLAIDKGLV